MTCDSCPRIASTLEGVRLKMESWAKLNRFEAFAMQREIMDDITWCHNQISDCLGKFQVAHAGYPHVLASTHCYS
jgi:hypothetical protein